MKSTLIAALLLGASATASADGLLLVGHVQRLTLEPAGTGHCPKICPEMVTKRPDGSMAVCMSRNGACETLELKVDQVLAGEAGATRQFTARSGEFGPFFHAVSVPVVVTEEAGSVHWAPVIDQDGRQFIDPKRLWKFRDVPASSPGDAELVELDEVLGRLGLER